MKKCEDRLMRLYLLKKPERRRGHNFCSSS